MLDARLGRPTRGDVEVNHPAVPFVDMAARRGGKQSEREREREGEGDRERVVGSAETPNLVSVCFCFRF